MVSTFLLPSFLLPNSSSATLCYNHLSLTHSMLSVLCHILLFVIRTVFSKWPQKRQLTKNKNEDVNNNEEIYHDHQEEDISEEFSHFSARFLSPAILQHYCLIWLSIITSPRGLQLDFWLVLAVFMDCAPVVISIYYTLDYAMWIRNTGQQISDPDMVVWRLTSVMRSWSPAYQLNNWIMNYCDGCVIKHVYILFFVTLSITQTHKLIVTNLYCIKLP